MTISPPAPISTDPATTGDMRVSLRRVAALYSINEAMTLADSEEQALQIAATGLTVDAGYAHALIMTVDRTARLLCARAGSGNKEHWSSIRVPLDAPDVTTTVVRSGKPQIIPDAVAQADRDGWGDLARHLGMDALIQVPFGSASAISGLISVGTARTMEATEELTLLSLFATQIAGALARITLDAERQAALEAASIAQERLLETVRELSTPAMPIYDGILTLPLVGNIDTGRAGQVMETVLTSIQREHASVVILDVTGVPVIDTGVAHHLVQVTQAAQLLGARCLLVGIKPEVAQTLVQLGVDLSSIATRSDLQAGVAYALAQRGLRIVANRT